jgi:hypothetical protein
VAAVCRSIGLSIPAPAQRSNRQRSNPRNAAVLVAHAAAASLRRSRGVLLAWPLRRSWRKCAHVGASAWRSWRAMLARWRRCATAARSTRVGAARSAARWRKRVSTGTA